MSSIDLLLICAAAWLGAFAGIIVMLLRVKTTLERLIEQDVVDNRIAGVDVDVTVRHA